MLTCIRWWSRGSQEEAGRLDTSAFIVMLLSHWAKLVP